MMWISFAAGLIGDNVGEKGGEFGRGVPPSRFAEHLASLGVEGGLQRQGDMTEVRSWPGGRDFLPRGLQ
jgi:hypothetical protein